MIIPFYNRIKLLSRAVKSVMEQTQIEQYTLEIVLIDDFSDEKYTQPISGDKYIFKMIRNNENLGVGKSRQIGITHATGDYFFFLDSDDYWYQTHIYDSLNFMKINAIKAVCSSYIIESKNRERKIKNYKVKKLKHCNFQYINPVGFSTFAIESVVLTQSDIRFPSIRKRNDFIFLSKISRLTDIGVKTSPTVHYNSDTGMTRNKISLIPFQWNTYRKYFGYSIVKSAYALLYWVIYHKLQNFI